MANVTNVRGHHTYKPGDRALSSACAELDARQTNKRLQTRGQTSEGLKEKGSTSNKVCARSFQGGAEHDHDNILIISYTLVFIMNFYYAFCMYINLEGGLNMRAFFFC